MTRKKSLAALVASFASLSLWGVSPAHAQFTENFNSLANGQKSANFSDANPSPGWVATNGAYGTAVNDNPVFSFVTVNAAGYTSLSSFTYTVDVLSASDSGLIMRSDATGDNGLTVILRNNSVNKDFYFIRRTGGSFSNMVGTVSLASAGLSGTENLRLTVTGSGNTFTASAARISNPSSALATINHTFNPGEVANSGRVGLYQYTGFLDSTQTSRPARSSFDNLSVVDNAASVAAPEPGTLALLCAGLPLGVVLRRRVHR